MPTKTDHKHPLWELLDKLQMDARDLNARITEVRALVSQIELETKTREEFRCHCGNTSLSVAGLQEHAYHHHQGPLPDHWAQADRLAGDTQEVLQ